MPRKKPVQPAKKASNDEDRLEHSRAAGRALAPTSAPLRELRAKKAVGAPARIGIYSKTVMVEPTRTHGIIGFHVLSALVDGWPADNRRPEPHRYARSKATDVCEICGCAEGEPWHSGK